MEFRGTDKRSMPSSSSSAYNNPSIIRDQQLSFTATTTLLSPTSTGRGGGGGGERRSNNGSTSAHHLYQNQVLDHHQKHQQHHRQRVQQPVDNQLDPDPVSIAGIDTPVASPIAVDGSTTQSLTTIRYRECLKNHAAIIGGHVIDGCGEFMPSGDEGTREALKCAACDCHRNFHRKEVDGESQSSLGANCYYCYNPSNKNDRGSRSVPPRSHSHHPLTTPTTTFLPTPIQQHQSKFHQLGLPNSPPSGPLLMQPMMMAFGGGGSGGGAESSSEEYRMFGGFGQSSHPGSSKKRFRTKFTHEQKDKLLEFAEKIGWRIQKQDEQEVQQFCAEVGVKREVFKVWMHNNKHVMRKK